MSETLYYYTRFATAANIISENSLRLYRSTVMNDPREIYHGFDLYYGCLEEALGGVGTKKERDKVGNLIIDAFDTFNLYQDKRYTTQLLEQCGLPTTAAEIQHYARTNGPPNSDRYRAVYMTCFSAREDDLSMWRAYGDRGAGVQLGFEHEHLSGLQFDKPGGGHAKVQLDPVEYEDDVTRAKMMKDIERMLPEGENVWIAAEKCYKHLVLSKHICYKDEDEWRLFVYAKAHMHLPRIDVTGQRPRPYMKLSNFGSIGRLPLSKVRTGPIASFDGRTDESWKLHVLSSLKMEDEHGIDFSSSDLPYRTV